MTTWWLVQIQWTTRQTSECCSSKYGFIVNPAKNQFGLSSIKFLGHHVTLQGAIRLPAVMIPFVSLQPVAEVFPAAHPLPIMINGVLKDFQADN